MKTLLRRTRVKNEIRSGWVLSLKLRGKWRIYHLNEAGLRVVQFGPFVLEIY